jgi:cyclohexanone monooxygenase
MAQRRSVRAVQGHLAGSVWQSGCRSWYLNDSGRNFAIWPWTTMRYWWTVRRLKRRDYMLGS